MRHSTRRLGRVNPMDWAVAQQPLPGRPVSGDAYVVQPYAEGVLLGTVDAIGHGSEAASTAAIAVATLQQHAHEPLIALMWRCHEALRSTDGAVMCLASVNGASDVLTWLGVGTGQGVLMRASALPTLEMLQFPGVVGLHLPRVTSVGDARLLAGDTLILATDGIHSDFMEGLDARDDPGALARRILADAAKGTDDALVLVARYRGAER